MSEPVILNAKNNERAYKTTVNVSEASDRDIRHAIKFYTADNKDNEQKARKVQSLIDYHKSEGYDTGWDELTLSGYKGRINGNSMRLRILKREYSKRRLNRM